MLIAFALLLGLAVSFSPLSRYIKRYPCLPFLVVALAIASTAGMCNPAWLGAVSAMLPSIVTLIEAIVSFAAGLTGKTVSTATLNFIQKVAMDVKGEITNVQALIASYKANPTNDILSNISAVLNTVMTNLGSIMSNANITDGATVGKLSQLIGLGVAACQAVLGLIPLVISNMTKFAAKSETSEEVKHADKQGEALVAHHHKALQDGYKLLRSAPTGSPEVDAVLETLPAKI